MSYHSNTFWNQYHKDIFGSLPSLIHKSRRKTVLIGLAGACNVKVYLMQYITAIFLLAFVSSSDVLVGTVTDLLLQIILLLSSF